MPTGYPNFEKKPDTVQKPSRYRREDDRCWFIAFWHRWGPHLDLSGLVTCICLLCTIIWVGTGFIRDTRELAPKIEVQQKILAKQGHDVQLVTARVDRVDQNMQIIMRSMNLRPVPKSGTEKLLERQTIEITDSPEAFNAE